MRFYVALFTLGSLFVNSKVSAHGSCPVGCVPVSSLQSGSSGDYWWKGENNPFQGTGSSSGAYKPSGGSGSPSGASVAHRPSGGSGSSSGASGSYRPSGGSGSSSGASGAYSPSGGSGCVQGAPGCGGSRPLQSSGHDQISSHTIISSHGSQKRPLNIGGSGQLSQPSSSGFSTQPGGSKCYQGKPGCSSHLSSSSPHQSSFSQKTKRPSSHGGTVSLSSSKPQVSGGFSHKTTGSQFGTSHQGSSNTGGYKPSRHPAPSSSLSPSHGVKRPTKFSSHGNTGSFSSNKPQSSGGFPQKHTGSQFGTSHQSSGSYKPSSRPSSPHSSGSYKPSSRPSSPHSSGQYSPSSSSGSRPGHSSGSSFSNQPANCYPGKRGCSQRPSGTSHQSGSNFGSLHGLSPSGGPANHGQGSNFGISSNAVTGVGQFDLLVPTGSQFQGMMMMMMPPGLPLIQGSCTAATYCVPANTCDPYTGFIIRDPKFVAAAIKDAPTVARDQCSEVIKGGIQGLCCQENPHYLASLGID